MSLETIVSFILSLTSPLTYWISEKIANRFGASDSLSRNVVIHGLAFFLLLIPVVLLLISLIGMVIFSFQMLNAGF